MWFETCFGPEEELNFTGYFRLRSCRYFAKGGVLKVVKSNKIVIKG